MMPANRNEKTIRIWDGCRVVQVITISRNGSSSTIGSTGGAANSTKVDIEIDPFAGLIVDHTVEGPPINWRQAMLSDE
jgi:hypothetical protein